jgi:hypothetical protein
MPEAVWVDLTEAIAVLRQQLTDAIDEGKDKGMHFQLAPIELTVQAAVTTKGTGKLGWKILEVGGGVESASTQSLTLKLTPVWKMQDGTVVTDPLISASLPAEKSDGAAAGTELAPNRLDEQVTDD